MKTVRLITLLALTFFTGFAEAQSAKNTYSPKLPQVELSIAKINLARILKTTSVWQSGPNYIPPPPLDEIVNVSVSNNRIQIDYKSSNQTIYFSDIFQNEIGVSYCKGKPSYPCLVMVGNYYFSFTYYFSVHNIRDGELTKELADYLLYFQHYSIQNVKQRCDSLITLFKPIVEQYRELKVKPIVSEEQRKYIVQANSFNEQKLYGKAIELNEKAIEVDQTSYPPAYTNLALLSAQVKDFQKAIYYMTKYLMLVPEAEDARSCQDKIYVWEAMMQK